MPTPEIPFNPLDIQVTLLPSHQVDAAMRAAASSFRDAELPLLEAGEPRDLVANLSNGSTGDKADYMMRRLADTAFVWCVQGYSPDGVTYSLDSLEQEPSGLTRVTTRFTRESDTGVIEVVEQSRERGDHYTPARVLRGMLGLPPLDYRSYR